VAGFVIRTRFAGHPGRSAKARHALRLKPDHSIGAGQSRTRPATSREALFSLAQSKVSATTNLLKAYCIKIVARPPIKVSVNQLARPGRTRVVLRVMNVNIPTPNASATATRITTVFIMNSINDRPRNSKSARPIGTGLAGNSKNIVFSTE
jgi:hypothetical protein